MSDDLTQRTLVKLLFEFERLSGDDAYMPEWFENWEYEHEHRRHVPHQEITFELDELSLLRRLYEEHAP